ncbi:DinB family protein [Paenibacillus medicaginis]|uniref:DinB family protein n=1 Tax=Paenibacillus medicaginis TaxID=1470560 RepID=A0ABV5BY40_9BACL
MSDVYAFHLMAKIRQSIRKQLESLSEDQRNVVPAGFNNSIHWQLGHMVTLADMVICGIAGKQFSLPESYKTFFAPGTKPADWTAEPPAWDGLLQLFDEQPSRLREDFAAILDEPVALKENFGQAETIEELVYLSNVHESSHAGMVNAMVRILNKQ